jgi:hypothetical protein
MLRSWVVVRMMIRGGARAVDGDGDGGGRRGHYTKQLNQSSINAGMKRKNEKLGEREGPGRERKEEEKKKSKVELVESCGKKGRVWPARSPVNPVLGLVPVPVGVPVAGPVPGERGWRKCRKDRGCTVL